MYSVVIPVYMGAKCLPELHRRLKAVLEGLGVPYEIILVDDGSTDQSWQVIEELARANEAVNGIHLARNFGQHNTLLCGIRAARFPVIITLDDDLQNPPEEIPNLLRKLTDDFDVVYGIPEAQQHGLWRDMASSATKWTLKAMGAKNATITSPFRAFRTYLRDAFSSYDGSFVSIDVLLAWGTNSFTAVTVSHHSSSSSGYTIRKLVSHALDIITGFSVMPLRAASVLGFFLTAFGGVILLYVLVRYIIEGGSVPGFPFLASIIAVFSGAQMLCLGIIGEYLARVHFRTMKKPTYLVRKTVGALCGKGSEAK